MRKPVVIFDLDGTLANMEHRLHWAKSGNWDTFFSIVADDTPIKPMCDLVNDVMVNGTEVHIWTGRSEVARNDTLWWLRTFVAEDLYEDILEDPARLRMRASNDRSKDSDMKRRWWEKTPESFQARVRFVVEDRDRVVQMWRGLGLTCLQCAPGQF